VGTAPDDDGRLEWARSWLFVPGDKADRWLAKATAADPDVLIVDLEDAVAVSRKDAARDIVAAALERDRPSIPLVIRINGINTPWWTDDLEMAVTAGVTALMVPKVGSADDVACVAALLDARGPTSDPPSRRISIVPLIETAAGVLRAEAIAGSHRVVAVALGGEDLAVDIGVTRTPGGAELEFSRGHLVLACAASGCGAIDTPTLDTRDTGLVSAQASAARALGFTGMQAIHPSQVAPINAAFEPLDDEIEWAHAVVDAFELAARSGSGVTVVGERMVDAPVVAAARRVLGRARPR
jgi:citrate lyase subunit beta/citryl-CoA lyase